MPASGSHKFDPDYVTGVYLEALEMGLHVVLTISEVFDCSLNQARHMVRTIREGNLLGVPPHHPARAVIHRGTAKVSFWLACEQCYQRWPCPDSVVGHKPPKPQPATEEEES